MFSFARSLIAPVLAVGAFFACANHSAAVDPPLTSRSIAPTFGSRVTAIASAPGDYSRLFVTEQTGRVRLIKNGVLQTTPFLDLSAICSGPAAYLEYGLLGIGFHPDYIHNGYFYVTYTPGNSTLAHWTLARYRVSAANPDVADPASAQVILSITYDIKQHRAGWVEFGPDGYLYTATGDGGEGDPSNAASNILASSNLSWRGKILRLDINGPDNAPGTPDDDGFPADATKHYLVPPTNPFAASATNRPEIWAYGLRNPWKCTFDRLTGDMYIGDVGQSLREEVSFQPAGVGGLNYGWRCREGSVSSGITAGCTPPLPDSVAPVIDYARQADPNFPNGASVTGGYVYRGCAMPDLHGVYFFADWVSGEVYSFRYSQAGGRTQLTNRGPELSPTGAATIGNITAFGQDAFGEIYYFGTGGLWKIIPRTAAPDCNANGIADACELAAKLLHDRNHNIVPDECEPGFCLPDIAALGGAPGADHAITVDDLVFYLSAFFAGTLNVADISSLGGDPFPDGQITPDDLVDYLAAFFAGCP
ncbi:MAG: PQQ-dependent sugar dehydrogenase [Phycisphaerales bacterium]